MMGFGLHQSFNMSPKIGDPKYVSGAKNNK